MEKVKRRENSRVFSCLKASRDKRSFRQRALNHRYYREKKNIARKEWKKKQKKKMSMIHTQECIIPINLEGPSDPSY